jgi:hypothetical protein
LLISSKFLLILNFRNIFLASIFVSSSFGWNRVTENPQQFSSRVLSYSTLNLPFSKVKSQFFILLVKSLTSSELIICDLELSFSSRKNWISLHFIEQKLGNE